MFAESMNDRSISLKVLPSVVLLVLFGVEGFLTSSADSQIFLSENCADCLISKVVKRYVENHHDNNTNLTDHQNNNLTKLSSDDNHNEEVETVLIIGTLIFSMLLNITAFVVLVICCQKKKKQSKEKKKNHELITQMFNTIIFEKKVKTEFWSKSSLKSKADKMEYEIPLDLYWEFPRANVTLDKFLGEGAFGKVLCGKAKGILQDYLTTTVAVKMLKDKHSDDDMINLVSEMEIMKIIGEHENIINLLGCCTQDGPLFVIMEFAVYGNLRDFLRDHRPLSQREISIESNTRATFSLIQLVSFALQVCKGMQYLISKKCIHRDLAARNVLVSEDYTMKIADFGLAKNMQTQDYYKKTSNGKLPVKWIAPEALLHYTYTMYSDVWSFGILLWEIMTFGGTPYPTMPSEQLFDALQNGYRMGRPPCCPQPIFMTMSCCWNQIPEMRPTFDDLVKSIDQILESMMDNQNNQEENAFGFPPLDTPPSSSDCSE